MRVFSIKSKLSDKLFKLYFFLNESVTESSILCHSSITKFFIFHNTHDS
ncbi:hypothetical protein HOF65_07995 [bacterium]|nr:hypothetical protein [bacterium]MBT3853833.1 hypothetical protein [bacterium]MBT4632864.1 hypothetical protein [bacterium]MBT6779083.1 hypothetical protein [bacterium]